MLSRPSRSRQPAGRCGASHGASCQPQQPRARRSGSHRRDWRQAAASESTDPRCIRQSHFQTPRCWGPCLGPAHDSEWVVDEMPLAVGVPSLARTRRMMVAAAGLKPERHDRPACRELARKHQRSLNLAGAHRARPQKHARAESASALVVNEILAMDNHLTASGSVVARSVGTTGSSTGSGRLSVFQLRAQAIALPLALRCLPAALMSRELPVAVMASFAVTVITCIVTTRVRCQCLLLRALPTCQWMARS